MQVYIGERGGIPVDAAGGDYAGGALEEARRGEPGVDSAPAAGFLGGAVGIGAALGVDVPVGVFGAA